MAIKAATDPARRQILVMLQQLWRSIAEESAFMDAAEAQAELEIVARIHDALTAPSTGLHMSELPDAAKRAPLSSADIAVR